MPIDRGSSGSDQPSEDEAQRPRDNRPLDFTRPTYRPQPYNLPDPRESYKELFGDLDDRSDTGEQAEGSGEHKGEHKAARHDRLDVPDVGAKPGNPASVVEHPELPPTEQSDADDRPVHSAELDEQTNSQGRPAAASESTDTPRSRQSLDRPDEATTDGPRHLGEGIRGWWNADHAEGTEAPGSPYKGSNQLTAEAMARHPDKPAEPQEVGPKAPAAPSPGPTAADSRHTERTEQPDTPGSDRPLTWGEQLQANREVRYFPGWGPTEVRPPGHTDQGGEGGSGISYVFGKAFETKRGMEGLAEAKREDVRTDQQPTDKPAAKPDASGDTEPESTRGWKTIAEETGEVKSFPNYRAAKRELGRVENTEIHHVVEQSQVKPERSGFDVERVNSTDNLTRIPTEVHRKISALYSSKPPGFDLTVRDQQDGLSWEDQYEYGCEVLDQYMGEQDDRG